MSYTPNIPTINQSLDETRDPINSNFKYLNTWAGQDHFFNVSNGGKHKPIHMPINASNPPSTISNEGCMYVRTKADESNLFFTNDNNGKQYQLTQTDNANFTTFAANVSYGSPPSGFTQEGGWTFLPGGLLLQYGFYGKTGSTPSSGNIQFPKSFANASSIYSITLVTYRGSGRPASVDSSGSITATKFPFVLDSSGSDGIYWQAIGV